MAPSRTDQITALLRSLYDYLPDPKTASLGDLPGPAPSEWADCKPCGGVGSFGKVKRPCAACEGTGSVKVDAYTGEPVGTDGQKVKVASKQRIDAELSKLAANAEIRMGGHVDDPFAWEANRIRYRQAGSYASIERALDSLRINDPDACSVVMATTVYGWSPVTEANRDTLGRGLAFIARRTPPELRVPRWVTDPPPKVEREWPAGGGAKKNHAPAKERNERIISMAHDGKTRREIAEYVGCSTATVSRVLAAVEIPSSSA